MAAAVQTNLSVAFTHGAQLTMDHCGALIHGAAILWSRLPSQLPQENLLLCAPILARLSCSIQRSAGDDRKACLAQRHGMHLVCFHGGNDSKDPGFYLFWSSRSSAGNV